MVSINSATVFLGGPYQKGLWSVSLICQAWSLSHIRHTNDRQPGAYHALNKRGRIPCVFPHEDTSCSRGRVGFWVSFGNIPRTTLPPPKVLSAHFAFLFFFSIVTIFILQQISTSHSTSHSSHLSLWIIKA